MFMQTLIKIFTILTAISMIIVIIKVILAFIITKKHSRAIKDNVTNQVVDSFLKDPNKNK